MPGQTNKRYLDVDIARAKAAMRAGIPYKIISRYLKVSETMLSLWNTEVYKKNVKYDEGAYNIFITEMKNPNKSDIRLRQTVERVMCGTNQKE